MPHEGTTLEYLTLSKPPCLAVLQLISLQMRPSLLTVFLCGSDRGLPLGIAAIPAGWSRCGKGTTCSCATQLAMGAVC